MIKLKFMFEILNMFLLALGAMIGVGFLSGAEIWSFFARFGDNFAFSILTIFVLLFVFLYKIMRINHEQNNIVILQKCLKNPPKNAILVKSKIRQLLLNFNILLLASAMFSGLRNVIDELFLNNKILIFVLIVFLIFIVLSIGTSAVSKFNILIISAFFSLLILIGMRFDVFAKSSLESLSIIKNISANGAFERVLLAAIYIFLNIAQLVPIFKESKIRFSKKGMLCFSLLFSLVFCFLITILTLFLAGNSYLTSLSMPLLSFFIDVGGLWEIVFVAAIVGGLLSTLLVCLMGLKSSLKRRIKSPILASYIAIIFSLLFGFFPFSFFINVVYPIIGVISFVTFVLL